MAGAPDEILYFNKPHAGTFHVVSMVEQMRATTKSSGGKFHFLQRVDDLDIAFDADGGRRVFCMALASGETLRADAVVVAVGHGPSAGYAGGILSAGVDGIRAAEWVASEMIRAGIATAT